MDRQLFLRELSDLISIMFRLNRSIAHHMDCSDLTCVISPLQMQALIMVRKESLTMTQLAERLLMTRQQLTKVIDALVKKGFVLRVADPGNRRHVMVKVSENGKQFLLDSIASHPFFSLIDEPDSRKLLDAMSMIKEVLASYEKQQIKSE